MLFDHGLAIITCGVIAPIYASSRPSRMYRIRYRPHVHVRRWNVSAFVRSRGHRAAHKQKHIYNTQIEIHKDKRRLMAQASRVVR